MSVCGAYDMAGNAKEWCWNEAGAERRYILGGGWSDPEYMYISADALNPFDRSPANGFRCIKLTTPGATDPSFDAPVLRTVRTYADERPIGDAEFQQFTSVFTYDKTNLAPQLESVDDTNPRWRKERVSFNTAYNNERMGAVLFLPKRVSPPFQTLVYMPSDGAKNSRSSEYLSDQWLFLGLVENGRALIYPIYKGTYERGPRPGTGSAAHRDYVIEVSKDLGRAIDYLETREDIRADRLAYVGYSTGANLGSLLPAVEKRFKALVLVGGGFTDAKPLAMVDPINFAPRVTIPTLMLNGRYDFIRPLETSQLPMYRWLGAPVADKRHVVYECGHTVPPKQAEAEMQAWLAHYLGRLK